MEGNRYQVLFKGELLPEADIATVKQKLTRAFRADTKKIEALFTGETKIVKKNATRDICERTKRIFNYAGAVCEIVPLPPPATAPAAEAERPSTPADASPASPETTAPVTAEAPDTLPAISGPAKAASTTAPAEGTQAANKTALLLLTAFLGFVGIHKFYLRQYVQGVLFLLFCWTLLPGLISVVEFIIYAASDSQKLQTKYPRTASMPLLIIVGVCGPFLFLAATGALVAAAFYFFVLQNPQNLETIISDYLFPKIMPSLSEVSSPSPTRPSPAAPNTNQAAGQINGEKFVVDRAEVRSGILHLKQGQSFFANREIIIFPFLNGESPENRIIDVSPDGSPQFGLPHIHLRWRNPITDEPRSDIVTQDYRMHLAFGKITGQTIGGTIDLEIPGDTPARVSGTFTATITD